MSTKPEIKEPCCGVCLFSRTNESYTTDEKKICCHACPPHELRDEIVSTPIVSRGHICYLFQMKPGAMVSGEAYQHIRLQLKGAQENADKWYRSYMAKTLAIRSFYKTPFVPGGVMKAEEEALKFSTEALCNAVDEGILVNNDD